MLYLCLNKTIYTFNNTFVGVTSKRNIQSPVVQISLKTSNAGESFVLNSSIFPLQYLGFGMPANSSKGRRAAQASAAPMDDDQLERDANLKKVQAKDLVEFGMIPVSRFDNTFQLCYF